MAWFTVSCCHCRTRLRAHGGICPNAFDCLEALSDTVVADYGFSPGTNSRFQSVVDIHRIYIDLRYGKPRSRNGQIILFNPEIKKWCVTNVS